jgi:uncharacterized protein GlcG (DUF336 family)
MMTLDQALTIARTSLTEAKSRTLAPLCVVVVDPGGHVLVTLRDERASIGRPEIATAKAAGCLAMGFGGRELARRAQAAPGFYGAIGGLFAKGMVTVPGGVLIRDEAGALLGAVGISGDTADNDELCALAGIAAAGLVADSGG